MGWWDWSERFHEMEELAAFYLTWVGSNEWRPSPDKDHDYLVKRTDPGELARIIDELML